MRPIVPLLAGGLAFSGPLIAPLDKRPPFDMLK
jgi:hypothetical protein